MLEYYCDFNFFIINPATARGLYQHYHQSAATNTFCYFCRKQYEDLKRLRISEEIQKAGGNFAPNSVKKRIEKGFKGSLRYITIVKKESFNECLKTLKRIKSFSFEYMTLVAEEKKFAPVFAVASKVSNKAIFRKSETKMQAITGAISDMISSSRLKRASVKGMDP